MYTIINILSCGIHIIGKITELFNCSFRTSSVPLSWKRAIIVPIFKSGNPRHVGNYRPIALTPTPCKLIEKLAHKHIIFWIILIF